MITRRDIVSIVGPKQGASAIACVLDAIRRDDLAALATVARMTGSHVARGLGVQFVADLQMTLARTWWDEWIVVRGALVHRAEGLAAIAIVNAIPSTVGMELNCLHVSASVSHRTVWDTAHLLASLVMDGEIEPTGIDSDTWLFGVESHASDPRSWAFDVAA